MRNLLICLSLIVLTACAAPIREVVTQSKTELITIPDPMLRPCKVTTPPDQSYFADSVSVFRETILTDYTISLLGDLKNCNKQLKEIKDYQNRRIQDLGGTIK